MPSISPHERILQAATDLFYNEGIRATGVDTLIARAEVAKASFYKHFPSKDDLILAYVERQSAQVSKALRTGLAAVKGGPKAKLLGLFDVVHGIAADPNFQGCRFIRATAELERNHPARKAALAHKVALRDHLRELAVEAGLLKPAALADQLALLVDGAFVRTWMYGTPEAAVEAKAVAKTLLS